ncbi:hypothetical protein [Thalassoroseus pseudoceratinae]|uniref:hypothetical protein n=1 Tax=Thalassoroseus pseudoceratinae TaxID=2713176 RepID=UPI001F0DB77F|nr:hypothetical protein [Thalassoroseus pseudoceratinae]
MARDESPIVIGSLAEAGTLGVIDVYPPTHRTFPIGRAMMRNLTIKMGNCHHRRYSPHIVELVRGVAVRPTLIPTHDEPMTSAIDAYQTFDDRQTGWMKVMLEPSASSMRESNHPIIEPSQTSQFVSQK